MLEKERLAGEVAAEILLAEGTPHQQPAVVVEDRDAALAPDVEALVESPEIVEVNAGEHDPREGAIAVVETAGEENAPAIAEPRLDRPADEQRVIVMSLMVLEPGAV